MTTLTMIAALLASPLGPPPPQIVYEDWTPAYETEMMQILPLVRSALDDTLFDYPRTRFRNVEVRRVDGVIRFCGEINALNRMGGYGGWQEFVAIPGIVAINAAVARQFCFPTNGTVSMRTRGDASPLLTYRP